MLAFDSLNPYSTLGVIIADSPQELVTKIQAIRTPIGIVQFVSYGTRIAAFYTGDVPSRKVELDGTTANTKRQRAAKIR